MIILGAGMAGCLAGALNPKATILEANDEIPNHHKAVLRFRDDKISRALGIDFKTVTVRKAIWFDGKEAAPSPRMSNLYSKKVTGKILDRSINNLETVTRYIAPSDFHNIVGDMCHGRITFGKRVNSIGTKTISATNYPAIIRNGEIIISTMPMPVLLEIMGVKHNQDFSHAPISVTRFEVPNCDIHQTIYYPDHDLSIYRATLTGDQLIIESTGAIGGDDLMAAYKSLGLQITDLIAADGSKTKQQYGKIAPIDDDYRKMYMYNLSQEYGIYSLGRFATWKNILLDDVYDDIYAIKRLSNKGKYDAQLEELT